eukprot:Rmarinus@m.15336
MKEDDRNDSVYDILVFLEASIHTILFLRKIYPAELFEKRQLYGVPVNVNRHPLVRDYLGRILQGIGADLKNISAVNLSILRSEVEIEVFKFSINSTLDNEHRISSDAKKGALLALTRIIGLHSIHGDTFQVKIEPINPTHVDGNVWTQVVSGNNGSKACAFNPIKDIHIGDHTVKLSILRYSE